MPCVHVLVNLYLLHLHFSAQAFGLLYRDGIGSNEAKIENDIGEESKNIFCTYKREKLKDSAGEWVHGCVGVDVWVIIQYQIQSHSFNIGQSVDKTL